jgi:hypothetical protein
MSQPNYKTHSPEFDRNHQVGLRFEQFIVQRFSTHEFTLMEWQGDKSVNGISALSRERPDLVYRHSTDSSHSFFAVECKYRDKLRQNFDIKKAHFENYQSFFDKTHIPVYIALGVGNSPELPYEVFIIPLKDVPGSLLISDKRLLFYRRYNSYSPFHWEARTRYLY